MTGDEIETRYLRPILSTDQEQKYLNRTLQSAR